MRKAIITFKQGDPLPAGKMNSLVGSTAEVSEAATREHSPEGLHLNPRLEFAMAALAKSGSSWSTEFGDRVSISTVHPSGAIEIVIDFEDMEPLSDLTVGVIAYADTGEEVPSDKVSFESPKATTNIKPPANANMIFVTVVGRRRVP